MMRVLQIAVMSMAIAAAGLAQETQSLQPAADGSPRTAVGGGDEGEAASQWTQRSAVLSRPLIRRAHWRRVVPDSSTTTLDSLLPRFGIDLAYRNLGILEEAGIEMYRSYPIKWNHIEPYEPGSSVISSSLITKPERQEVVSDENGALHFFDWTRTDDEAELYHGEEADRGIVLFFSMHGTSPWASKPECARRKWDEETGELLDAAVNCPLKDAESEEHFRFYIGRFVERYDNDGVDDMPGLQRAVDYWQLGAEYNSNTYWDGTNQEYLTEWRAFAEVLRSTSETAWIISNGISNVHGMGDVIHEGGFHAGLAFKYTYEQIGLQLTPEERARADEVADNPLAYPTIEDVITQLALAEDDPREEQVRAFLESRQRSVEFTIMVLDNPALFDIFDARMYTYYRYQPGRIREDLTFVKENMSQRGYRKPIMPTEGSGAFLGRQGGMPNPERDEFFGLVTGYIDKEILGIDGNPVTDDEIEAYRTRTAEQAREVVKVYATLFAEGSSAFVWYRFSDIVDEDNAEWESPFRINGLLYQDGGRTLRKPAFFTYEVMTFLLRGFTSVMRIAEEQIEFTFTDRDPVFVLWTENPPGTSDLCGLVATENVRMIHIVTELDADNDPVYPADEILPCGSVTLGENPVFVTPQRER